MKDYGKKQGNMAPDVMDYQKPESAYSQKQPGKTTQYVERNDKAQKHEASKIRSQDYKGRYQ